MNYYTKRQERVLASLEDKSLFILASANNQTRSNDTEYPFRQNSNFYYLTGFKEDNTFLVLLKIQTSIKRILFVQAKDEAMELWTGKRLGVDKAKAIFDYDEVYTSEEFSTKMALLLEGVSTLYSDIYANEKNFLHVRELAFEHNEKRTSKTQITTFKDATVITKSLRLYKDAYEIECIKKAVEISTKAHHEVMRMCKASKMEYELQAEYEYIFKKNGAYWDAYTTIVAGGNSANTLHYISNDKPLVDGDLVLIDAGCEYEMYASDVTRTFPVNGRFSEAQKELYTKILDVEVRVIGLIKPGIKKSELQTFAEIELTRAMLDLSLLEGDVTTLVEEKKHKKYFPHGIGHWMGIDVHDEAPYFDADGEEIVFAEGMVLTIEPGLYIDENDENAPERFRGIGIRIEDDILVTNQGHEVLTQAIVKSVEDIEALMA